MLNRFKLEHGIVGRTAPSGLSRLLREGMRQIVVHAVVNAQREFIEDEVARYRQHLTAKMKEVIKLKMAEVSDQFWRDYEMTPQINVSVVLEEKAHV